jgi:hypothetical protein
LPEDEAEAMALGVVDVDVAREGSTGIVAGLPSIGSSARSISPLSSTRVERAEIGRPFSPSNRLRICSPMSSLPSFSLALAVVEVDKGALFLSPSLLRRPCLLPPLDRSPLAAFRFLLCWLSLVIIQAWEPASSPSPPGRPDLRGGSPPPLLRAPPPPPSGPVGPCGADVRELAAACGST